jgi:hypothetical protein
MELESQSQKHGTEGKRVFVRITLTVNTATLSVKHFISAGVYQRSGWPYCLGCTMAQAISFGPFTAEAWV